MELKNRGAAVITEKLVSGLSRRVRDEFGTHRAQDVTAVLDRSGSRR
jgi:hypothetical protein